MSGRRGRTALNYLKKKIIFEFGTEKFDHDGKEKPRVGLGLFCVKRDV